MKLTTSSLLSSAASLALIFAAMAAQAQPAEPPAGDMPAPHEHAGPGPEEAPGGHQRPGGKWGGWKQFPPFKEVSASAKMQDAKGKAAGIATFTQAPRGMLVRLELTGLTEGWHGAHIHETGECKPEDFTSAGAHAGSGHGAEEGEAKEKGRPTPQHGFLNDGMPHGGDLPNIWAGKDGIAKAEFFLPFRALKETRRPLLDQDGASLVVHEKADDYRTQPSGDSGARVACGVIKE